MRFCAALAERARFDKGWSAGHQSQPRAVASWLERNPGGPRVENLRCWGFVEVMWRCRKRNETTVFGRKTGLVGQVAF